jgi:uncharacterized protein YgiM (DUF1202 family)
MCIFKLLISNGMKKLVFVLLLIPYISFGQTKEVILENKKFDLQKIKLIGGEELYSIKIPSTNLFKKKNELILNTKNFILFLNSLDDAFKNFKKIETSKFEIIEIYQNYNFTSCCLIEFKETRKKSSINEDFYYEKLKPLLSNLKLSELKEKKPELSINKSNNNTPKLDKPAVIKYTKSALNLRDKPNTSSSILKVLIQNEKVLTQPLNEDWTIITNNTNVILGYVSSHYLSDTKKVIATKPKTRYFISQVPYKDQREIWRKLILAQDKATYECNNLYPYDLDEFGSCYRYRSKKYEEDVFNKNYITRDVWNDIKHEGFINKWPLP